MTIEAALETFILFGSNDLYLYVLWNCLRSSEMPRFISASADDSPLTSRQHPHIGRSTHTRLSHAVSAIELRGSPPPGHATSIARKRKGLHQSRRAASSFPLDDVNVNTHEPGQSSVSLLERDSYGSTRASQYDESHVLTPSSGLSKPLDAYPTPPVSERGESESATGSESSVFEETEPFPFPLNPVPLPALKFSTGTDHDAYHTPNRRWASAGVQPLTPSPSPSPDRYISNRYTSQEPSKTYRLSKSPHQLSSPEKLLRHNHASTDPFGPLIVPRIRNPRIGAPGGSTSAVQARLPRPIGTTNVTTVPGDASTARDRLSSAGAIWNIGGGALAQHTGPVRSISNGRGGFLSGGSNAPMYMSQFFEDDTLDQDLERMEARIAAALDIDQTTKILDISRSSPSPRSVSTGSVGLKRKRHYEEPRTRWRYGDWLREGSLSRESPCEPSMLATRGTEFSLVCLEPFN